MSVRLLVVAACSRSLLVPAAAADLADEQALAQKYAPVVRLVEQPEPCGPGEPYEPMDVDALFDEPSVALRGPWNATDLVKIAPTANDLVGLYDYHLDFPGDALNPGCGYEKWSRRITRGPRADRVRARRDRAGATPGSSRSSTGSSTPTTTGTTCTRATGR